MASRIALINCGWPAPDDVRVVGRLVNHQLGRLLLDNAKAVKVVRNMRVLKDRPCLGQNLPH